MNRILNFAILNSAILLMLASSALASDPLPRSAPEAQGVSSAKVLEFVEAADAKAPQMNSFMLVRHGKVVAEGWWTPYNAESRHELYSLSKSFTSTAVGLAIEEGKFKLDDKVTSFFPDDVPKDASDNLKAMTVRNILTMAAGHEKEAAVQAKSQPWTKTFLEQPVTKKPGEHFMYNTPATYMQSAIVQKTTGMTVLDYLKPRLFEPLGIDDPTWGTSPQGVSFGGYGLNIRTEDIAKFGQLYLQKGEWKGKQLVPKEWIAMATSKQVSNGNGGSNDWAQGYGFQFWMCRHGAYRGDGAFGQYCIVIPEKDAVIAITSGVKDMQGVMNLVWDKLLPALTDAKIEADVASQEKLTAKLKSLVVSHPKAAKPSDAALASMNRKYQFADNPQKVESVALESSDGKSKSVLLKINGSERRIECGEGDWKLTKVVLPGFNAEQPVAVSAAWTAADAFTTKICLYETPFISTMTLKFNGDEVTLDSERNVSFGQTKSPTLIGKAATP